MVPKYTGESLAKQFLRSQPSRESKKWNAFSISFYIACSNGLCVSNGTLIFIAFKNVIYGYSILVILR